MWVLGIETAGDRGGVSLWHESGEVYEFVFPARRRHAERLAPAVQGLLAQSGVTGGELGLIAVDVGPGSFTGVRIGVAFAKAMAQALRLPLVGVRQSEALGLPVAQWYGERVAVLIYDRRDLLYFAWAFPERVTREESLSFEDALKKLKGMNDSLCLVGTGALRLREVLARELSRAYILDDTWAYPRAATVACLGYRRFRQGGEFDPKALEPNYEQPPLAKEGSYGQKM